MRPTWADPTQNLLELRDRLYRLLDESFVPGRAARAPDFSPPVDILATDDRVVILVEAPGMSRDQIQVQVDDTVVTIRGERRVSEEDGRLLVRERPAGSFSRSFALAWSLDPETVEARLQDGLLEVSVRRRGGRQSIAVREE
ncbi:MAG: Hsp20/alpha crystallin family protein [Armatimonadota bacterium]